MEIAVRFVFGNCFKTTVPEYDLLGYHHGVSTATDGVLALAHDLFYFEITSKVPEQLSGQVASSMEAQVTWYVKLLQAWKDANPPPKTPQQASRLVIQTLDMADAEGLLNFYDLPVPPHDRLEVPELVFRSPRAERVKFVLQTLPVDARSVCYGDFLNVFVDAADPREAPHVPEDVKEASKALRASVFRDYVTPKAYQTIVNAGYRILRNTNKEPTLAKRYRVRLRGIDAPKNKMPYGKEAKVELTKLVQGKCLTVHVHGVDQFDRLIGDVYCSGLFAQKVMLKKGCARHSATNYKRPEFAKWEMEAKAAGLGLWASSNQEEPEELKKNNLAEMPWEWRIPIINNKMLGS